MDSRLAVRPAGGAQSAVVRPDAAPLRNAVATDLSPSQAVTAAATTDHANNEMPRPPLVDPSHLGDAILDPHSREVVYRAIDILSRRVMRQMPEVAARRLKAYTRHTAQKPASQDEHADIQV